MKYKDPKVYEYISKQTSNPIVERKICTISGTKFAIFQSDLDFYDKISSSFPAHLENGGKGGSKRYLIPTPTLCPEERARKRLSWRNERKLYKRKCDATGKDIISIYHPDSPYKVYESKSWHSDVRNPMDYGKVFDYERNFFLQFDGLMKEVPMLALIGANNENSKYINLTADSKNCYILIESSNNEDCYHSYWMQKCKKCCDSAFCHMCENSYEISNCSDCMNLEFSEDCQKCSHSMLLKNCENCSNCFGCINLQNQQYHIFNKKESKESYEDFMKNFRQDTYNNLKKYKNQFKELDNNSMKKYARVLNTEGSFCDYMRDAKNCVLCVDGYDAENCKYGEHVWRNAKNVMDVSTVGRDAERIYESINNGIGVYKDMFIAIGWGLTNSMYCYSCFNSSNLFGCVGLSNKEYCIFNKQYSKEEYKSEVLEIIGRMIKIGERGEFFPAGISPFGYNETVAMEQFPMTKEEIITRGYKYRDNNYQTKIPDGANVINAKDLTDNIDDSIINKVIICEYSGKPFRIIKQELEFYRKHLLPLPRKHPDVRHGDRMKKRKTEFTLRVCDKCEIEVLSAYPKNSKFKIYCENCYQTEIYG